MFGRANLPKISTWGFFPFPITVINFFHSQLHVVIIIIIGPWAPLVYGDGIIEGSLISANSYNRSTSPKYFLSEYLRSPNSSSVSNSWKKAQQEKWHNRKHFSSSPKNLNGISDDVAHLSYICHKASAQISATVNSQEPQIWEKLSHITMITETLVCLHTNQLDFLSSALKHYDHPFYCHWIHLKSTQLPLSNTLGASTSNYYRDRTLDRNLWWFCNQAILLPRAQKNPKICSLYWINFASLKDWLPKLSFQSLFSSYQDALSLQDTD